MTVAMLQDGLKMVVGLYIAQVDKEIAIANKSMKSASERMAASVMELGVMRAKDTQNAELSKRKARIFSYH